MYRERDRERGKDRGKEMYKELYRERDREKYRLTQLGGMEVGGGRYREKEREGGTRERTSGDTRIYTRRYEDNPIGGRERG